MRDINTIDIVRLNTGVVKLSDEQARPRQHQLSPVGNDGCYRIMQTVTFKAGERLGFDGEIKPIASKVEEAKTGRLMTDVLAEEKALARLTEQEQAAPSPNMDNVTDIMAVIDDLDQEADYTSGGKPEVKAIEALLDRDITAAERDEAWKRYLAQ